MCCSKKKFLLWMLKIVVLLVIFAETMIFLYWNYRQLTKKINKKLTLSSFPHPHVVTVWISSVEHNVKDILTNAGNRVPSGLVKMASWKTEIVTVCTKTVKTVFKICYLEEKATELWNDMSKWQFSFLGDNPFNSMVMNSVYLKAVCN